jgi:hypothetical protein
MLRYCKVVRENWLGLKRAGKKLCWKKRCELIGERIGRKMVKGRRERKKWK